VQRRRQLHGRPKRRNSAGFHLKSANILSRSQFLHHFLGHKIQSPLGVMGQPSFAPPNRNTRLEYRYRPNLNGPHAQPNGLHRLYNGTPPPPPRQLPYGPDRVNGASLEKRQYISSELGEKGSQNLTSNPALFTRL